MWKWNSITSTSRFLIRLVFCSSIKVLQLNAFHLIDIICSLFSYRKEKLLEFFRSYDTTQDSEKTPLNLYFLLFIIIHVSDTFQWLVLTFLRLVVAIWICSHREEYEQRVPDLSEHYSLKDVSISISPPLLNFHCIHSSTFYLTCCSTNSGAFSTSLHLVSTRTML